MYQKKSNEPAEALQHQSMCASATMLRGVAKDGDTRDEILRWHPFLVQKQVKTKEKGLHCKMSGFSDQIRRGVKESEKLFTTTRWSYGFTS